MWHVCRVFVLFVCGFLLFVVVDVFVVVVVVSQPGMLTRTDYHCWFMVGYSIVADWLIGIFWADQFEQVDLLE